MTATPDSPSIADLRISPEKKRTRRPLMLIAIPLVVVAAIALYVFYQANAAQDQVQHFGNATAKSGADTPAPAGSDPPPVPVEPGETLFQTSGYIVPRERIELSPRFLGTVAKIHVRKGDKVTAGQLLVELEDDEYAARMHEARARVALTEARLLELRNGTRQSELDRAAAEVLRAQASVRSTEANLARRAELVRTNSASLEQLDEARRAHDVAVAELAIAEANHKLAQDGPRSELITAAEAELAAAKAGVASSQVYLDWCTIHSPIAGTILTREVDAGELVVPQSFGGGRGPSTSFLSMADLTDLQVQIDLNEQFTAKVFADQRCIVTPRAFPDLKYEAYVFEVAPEANRSKGTLEIKVQVLEPDDRLTPELSAQVFFLGEKQPKADADRATRGRRTQ